MAVAIAEILEFVPLVPVAVLTDDPAPPEPMVIV
jgi:hypothetical protein